MASNRKGANANYQNYQQQATKSGNLKYEVASELGVELGPDTSARQNGRVGGSITKELVNRAKQSTDTESMKYETASELGVELGADASARQNGRVGGSMTKKLVNKGKQNN